MALFPLAVGGLFVLVLMLVVSKSQGTQHFVVGWLQWMFPLRIENFTIDTQELMNPQTSR